MRSFKKKIKTISTEGTQNIFEGFYNFKLKDKKIEDIAHSRMLICIKCPFFKNETISFLKVKDELIPELSNKMCDKCGCTLSYKLRQFKNKCSLWRED